MTYAQAFTPNNKMANDISNAMNNIELDNKASYSETLARINKHQGAGAGASIEGENKDVYLKNSAQNGTNGAVEASFTPYQAQNSNACANYSSPYMAQTYCAQAYSTQNAPAAQPASQTYSSASQYAPQTQDAPVGWQQTYPQTYQNYGQAQYNMPTCQQYQAYQAPSQYAQTQALPPAV